MFIDIAAKMERLDADIGALDRTLEQRPEAFNRIGVMRAFDIFARAVANDAVFKGAAKVAIAGMFVGRDGGSRFANVANVVAPEQCRSDIHSVTRNARVRLS